MRSSTLVGRLTVMKIGEDARIDLRNFSLEGARWADLRNTLKRGERDGFTVEIAEPPAVPSLIADLRAVSDAWLHDRRSHEMAFSVAGFRDAFVAKQHLASLRQGGKIVAFVSLMTTARGGEAAIGVMRHLSEAPPYAITLDRLADLLGNREPVPRLVHRQRSIRIDTRLGLENERRSCASGAFANPQVFRALLQGRDARGGASRCLRLGHASPIAAAAASCRQALATLGAAPGDDGPAAGGRHTVAESMPALAHELARLVGPFHVGSPFGVKALRALMGECRRRCRIIGSASTRAQPRP